VLVTRTLGALTSDSAFGSPTTGRLWLDLAVVVAWCAVCAAATVVGFRRDTDRERS